MDKGLEAMEIPAYDLDNLAPILLNVYDYQQHLYTTENAFSFFSLVGMALLELGVIIEYDEEQNI